MCSGASNANSTGFSAVVPGACKANHKPCLSCLARKRADRAGTFAPARREPCEAVPVAQLKGGHQAAPEKVAAAPRTRLPAGSARHYGRRQSTRGRPATTAATPLHCHPLDGTCHAALTRRRLPRTSMPRSCDARAADGDGSTREGRAGTLRMYRAPACRCAACFPSASEHTAAWRVCAQRCQGTRCHSVSRDRTHACSV